MKNDSPDSAEKAEGVHIHISGPWAAVLSVAILAAAVAPGAMAWVSRSSGIHQPKVATSSPAGDPKIMEPNSVPAIGPWGQLKLVSIETQVPEEVVSVQDYEDLNRRWVLPGYTMEKLGALLATTELTEAQRQDLMKSVQNDPSINGLAIVPDEVFLREMSTRTRVAVYTALGAFPQNMAEYDPFRYPTEQINEWLDDETVAPETIRLIRSLLYPRGSCMALSDMSLVLKTLATKEEKVRVVKMLSQQSSLLLRLHISPDSDLAALTKYWSGNGRVKNVKPMLETMATVRGGCDLAIIHLLPFFARRHLYSYCDPTATDFRHDCHWVAMNFWNEHGEGDDRYLDSANVRDDLQSKYLPVMGEYKYGDVILFMADESHMVHSAVYIADNILYSKNGGSGKSPCVLMDLDQLVTYYKATNPGLKLVGMRMKD